MVTYGYIYGNYRYKFLDFLDLSDWCVSIWRFSRLSVDVVDSTYLTEQFAALLAAVLWLDRSGYTRSYMAAKKGHMMSYQSIWF